MGRPAVVGQRSEYELRINACRIADQVAMLYKGRIVENLPPKEFLLSANPYVRKFIEADSYTEMRA